MLKLILHVNKAIQEDKDKGYISRKDIYFRTRCVSNNDNMNTKLYSFFKRYINTLYI